MIRRFMRGWGGVTMSSSTSSGETHADAMALGPIVIARPGRTTVAGGSVLIRPASSASSIIALYFSCDVVEDGCGDVFLVDGLVPPGAVGADITLALLAPYPFIAGVLPNAPPPERLPRSAGLILLQHYLEGLMALDRDTLCERQKALAVEAVRDLLGAALLSAEPKLGLGLRRRVSLADRITTYIDAHIREPLSVESLCSALACSRSALYRATAPAGGAAELIVRRRLLAARERLETGDDELLIGAVAEEFGFADAPRFNRRFKALFGVSPSEMLRRSGRRRRSAAPVPSNRRRGCS